LCFSCIEAGQIDDKLEQVKNGADKVLDIVDKITDIDSISIIVQEDGTDGVVRFQSGVAIDTVCASSEIGSKLVGAMNLGAITTGAAGLLSTTDTDTSEIVEQPPTEPEIDNTVFQEANVVGSMYFDNNRYCTMGENSKYKYYINETPTQRQIFYQMVDYDRFHGAQ